MKLADPPDAATGRILDAGLALFSDHGVRRTTMNEVADAADLGVATVYRRFPRKAQLVRAVILREATTVIGAVDAALAGPGTVEEQAAAGFTAFAHAVTDRPLLVRLLRGENERDGELVAPGDLLDQIMAGARDYLADWIRGLQAQGRFLATDADIVAEIEARLALSLVLAPEGKIPMHDDAATRAFAAAYLVPLLGSEY